MRNKEKNEDSIITCNYSLINSLLILLSFVFVVDGDGDYLNGEETFNQDIICEHGIY